MLCSSPPRTRRPPERAPVHARTPAPDRSDTPLRTRSPGPTMGARDDDGVADGVRGAESLVPRARRRRWQERRGVPCPLRCRGHRASGSPRARFRCRSRLRRSCKVVRSSCLDASTRPAVAHASMRAASFTSSPSAVTSVRAPVMMPPICGPDPQWRPNRMMRSARSRSLRSAPVCVAVRVALADAIQAGAAADSESKLMAGTKAATRRRHDVRFGRTPQRMLTRDTA